LYLTFPWKHIFELCLDNWVLVILSDFFFSDFIIRDVKIFSVEESNFSGLPKPYQEVFFYK
jgi:hypothetical protein